MIKWEGYKRQKHFLLKSGASPSETNKQMIKLCFDFVKTLLRTGFLNIKQKTSREAVEPYRCEINTKED